MPPKRTPATARLGADALFAAPAPAPAAPEAEPNVKVTFYITRAQNLKLERLRLKRLEAGARNVDKSDLVREAIDGLEG